MTVIVQVTSEATTSDDGRRGMGEKPTDLGTGDERTPSLMPRPPAVNEIPRQAVVVRQQHGVPARLASATSSANVLPVCDESSAWA